MDNEQKPTPPSKDPASPAARRPRRTLMAGALTVVVIGGLLWWHPWNRTPAAGTGASGAGASAAGGAGGHRGRGGPAAMANIPQPVQVASATQGEMPIVLSALGTVTPLANVTVKTQLSGYLQSVSFREGQIVKKGDVLAQIDPRPYQVSLENAEGTHARDSALLATARLDLKRYQTLLSQDSIASQTVDTQASLVKQYEGAVKTDQAAIDSAKLNLTYARITAPVSGRVGLRQVDPGNYVTPGDTNGLVVITQLQPMSVIFTTSEDNLPQILKQVNAGQKLSVTAYNRNNTVPLETGSLATLDNQIDTSTGTVKLRANFDNKEGMLFPNQFVNTRLLVDVMRNATIVPTSAVLTGSIGQFVYVVKPDNTVTVRKVATGPVDGERTSIVSGVAIGERVVTDGSDRLREGAKISIPADKPKGASGARGAGAASGASGTGGHHGGNKHGASQAAAPAAQ
ncbi:TPA: MdtA/MuxA family multidrug efflux RND transporter periplasmic adaptor subunit [Burkholderia aenigmatica]|uniref:MdtA/MuxA family multidrug efflux RND transporter periplasmic adaptor subunit n=1 Tax=Burkholderia sp. AU45251 TaxID=3059204 RepID=UPI0026555A1C|nr:MdtA/MuxA family multidrug efflux RND transporter periplasmic adaptor subunit [Burkholderia sp. AU45251]HDR9486451.1 MdtA/MuxA family multidrug efflux RND transporter periplasmic adaptor subunit [Burkholderia aenigmatica]MDN7519933.1 MdtA/MuxA family multidrug efflux RND transporter periplasmic adaptor subunit [Burkholderia sp. AU45251]HDR9517050.1 MdtA/MuxA family multidrug efflux RND transporter periplasmic adaptor subunit [Burkholderia aenigmatica]HDR9594871.1 MdtA/MuxA family multidrug e